VHVYKAYAQDLPFPDNTFHAIITDPPYYDNVYYSVLADFFYSWKRLLFASLAPELFRSHHTDESRELVASAFRTGGADQAHEQYCTELRKAIREAERVLRTEGIFSLVYSHASIRGWQALVQAYRASSLIITSVQPLSIERKARPRAMTSDAVNTCVVFVAHKTNEQKIKATTDGLESTFRGVITPIVSTLRESGWNDDDIGIAAFAQAVGLLANTSGCSDADDMKAFRRLEVALKETLPQFRVTSRGSL
jgi:putative DNA methylase